ncbi:MAG: TonB-dependent receptor [bacterium]|jgi:iron complex outermembrane receptor protein|nr:TonB-dependent receptor [bacterium]
MKRFFFALTLLMLFSEFSFSQGIFATITGKVIDSKTKEPLTGVNIQIVGTYLGGTSGVDGTYTLKKIPLKIGTLRFTMIGYKSAQVADIALELGSIVSIPTVEMEAAAIDMNPIVVTASKQQQDLSVIPHSVSVLPEIELIDRTPLRLDNALESIAGVHFIENHINIRGSSGYTRGVGSRVLLVVDEVPMMNSDNNEINWNILPVMDIERIEVIKGTGSALYGSNALGGVVNVITKSPTEVGRVKVRTLNAVYTNPRYDEWQWTNRTLNYSRNDMSYSKSFGGLGINLALGYHRSTGYRTDNDFYRLNTSAKLIYSFPDASKLTFYGGYSYENRSEFIEWQDQHNPLLASPFYSGAKLRLNFYDTYLHYQRQINARMGFKIRASFISSLVGDQYNRSNDYFPAEGIGAETKFDWMPHHSHNITFGTEYKVDGGHSKYIGNHQGFSIAPYIQDQWQLHRNMTVTLGLRYDDYQVINSNYRENHLNPKFGINFTPYAGTIFRFSGGSGFRAASITERFIDFKYKLFAAVPNEDLKAETVWSFDLGLRQEITNNWWIDAAVFHNDYYNYIEPVEEILDDFSLQVQFQNVIRARIRGIEIATKGSWLQDHLGFQANFTYMDAKDLHTNKPLTYRPEILAFFVPSVKIDPVEVQAEYRYASRIDSVMLYSYDNRVAQKIWTFRAYLRLRPFTAILALNNAFNYAYVQLERNMREIRNVSLTFMYEF